MDASACAMGWGERVARSHASRLEREGWIERHPMIRGDGSLLITTRRGVRMTGLPVTAPPAPEPTYWAHDCASAWTAAWLTARGAKDWMGPREVLRDPELKRRVFWSARVSLRTTGHRPDLLVHSARGPVPIEVELQRKNNPRTEGILVMCYGWIIEDTITGVAYICATLQAASEQQLAQAAPAARER